MPSYTKSPTPYDRATLDPTRVTPINVDFSCHGVDLFVGIRDRPKLISSDTRAVTL